MLLFNKANNFDEDDDTSKVMFNFGKLGDKIIVAEGYGTNVGVVINYHDNPSQYVVIDGKYLIDNYTLVSSSDYPSGF